MPILNLKKQLCFILKASLGLLGEPHVFRELKG